MSKVFFHIYSMSYFLVFVNFYYKKPPVSRHMMNRGLGGEFPNGLERRDNMENINKIVINEFDKKTLEVGKIYLLKGEAKSEHKTLSIGEPVKIISMKKDNNNLIIEIADSDGNEYIIENYYTQHCLQELSDKEVDMILNEEDPILKSEKCTKLNKIIINCGATVLGVSFFVFPFLFLQKVNITLSIMFFSVFIVLLIVAPTITMFTEPFVKNDKVKEAFFSTLDNVKKLKKIKEKSC